MLRFDVPKIDGIADAFQAQGVAVQLLCFDRGVIGAFADPDGNPRELAEVWADP